MSVLVAYVPTAEGRAALHAAVSEARSRDTRLVVLNASGGDALADPRHLNADVHDGLARELAALGIDYSIEVRSGREPVDEIVTASEADGVELVVIGLRRRSPVGKLLMGSAAQRILLEVERPVLAVKATR